MGAYETSPLDYVLKRIYFLNSHIKHILTLPGVKTELKFYPVSSRPLSMPLRSRSIYIAQMFGLSFKKAILSEPLNKKLPCLMLDTDLEFYPVP